jgi:hypothetical protein
MSDESFTLGPPTMEAEFASRCPACGEDIAEGDTIYWFDDAALWVCLGCGDA